MNFSRTTNLKILRGAGLALIIIVVATYASARSLNYARGPKITISEPVNGATISTTTTTIVGLLERAHNLTLNGQEITIDEQGHFKETILVFPGINYLTLAAKDQFGRTTETSLTLVGVKK